MKSKGIEKKPWLYRLFCRHKLYLVSWNIMDPYNRGVKYQCSKCGAFHYSR